MLIGYCLISASGEMFKVRQVTTVWRPQLSYKMSFVSVKMVGEARKAHSSTRAISLALFNL